MTTIARPDLWDRPIAADSSPAAGRWVARLVDGDLTVVGGPRSVLAELPRQQCTVVFDGVLYDRDALVAALADGGPPPESDAVLVARAYARWGEAVLDRIKGIYAVLVWDARRDLLLAARDRMGIYPLFYAEVGRDVVFSTSTDAVAHQPGVSRELNRAVLADHLCYRWHRIEETYYNAVRRVPPGHVVRAQRGSRSVSRYWYPVPPGMDPRDIDWVREGAVELFEQAFVRAVDRCVAQGPISIFLSGGLDSVSVAAVAAEQSARRGLPTPLALSLIFPDADAGEEPIQRAVAEQLGLPQVLMTFADATAPGGAMLSALEASRGYGAPVLSPWRAAYLRLGAEGASRGCKTILTGNGGDEWLGVTVMLAADLIRAGDLKGLYQLYRNMRRSYPLSDWRMIRNLLWRFGGRPLLAAGAVRALGTAAPAALRLRRRGFVRKTTPDWVAPDAALSREVWQRAEAYLPDPPQGSLYLHEMQLALDHPLASMEMEEIFESGRTMGMHVLSPFWDSDLVDLLYRVPPDVLNMGGYSKGLVRQAMTRRFPELGFDRQKKAIATPFFRSRVQSEGRGAWKAIGGTPALAELGIVDPRKLDARVEEILVKKQVREDTRIWYALSLETWARARL